jgi:disulfide bond formation protein DsbB
MLKLRFLLFFLAGLTLLLLLSGCGRSDRNTEAEAAAAESGAPGDLAAGQELYGLSCIACHGPTAEGVPGLGPDLTENEFLDTESDTAVAEFIKQGRPANDPANTTGIAMPPKGGDAALTDGDIQDIVAYLRSIHK